MERKWRAADCPAACAARSRSGHAPPYTDAVADHDPDPVTGDRATPSDDEPRSLEHDDVQTARAAELEDESVAAAGLWAFALWAAEEDDGEPL